MDKRLQKRVIIAVIYTIILFCLIYVFWLFLKGPSPSCFDNKKNQNETGIDCGGVCKQCIEDLAQQINIIETGFVKTVGNKVDLYAYIENPNQNFGVASMSYKFQVLDVDENIITVKWGKTFVLPQQKRYIVEQAVALTNQPYSVKFEFEPPQWIELTNYETPNIGVKNKIYRQSYPDEYSFMTLEGLIINRSNYDFATVEVIAILKNQEGKVVGVGRSVHNTITSDEERIFKIFWPYNDLQLKNAREDVYVLTNIFDNDNFLKAHGIVPVFEK